MKQILDLAICILALALSTVPAAAQQHYKVFTVLGDAMLPTLHNGQLIQVNMPAYKHHGPQRGDIIVFYAVP